MRRGCPPGGLLQRSSGCPLVAVQRLIHSNSSRALPCVAPQKGKHVTQTLDRDDALSAGNRPSTTIHVIKRDGSASDFDASKISVAISKAFLAVEGSSAGVSERVRGIVADLSDQVVQALTRRGGAFVAVHVEDIQDQVELALMRSEHHKVARAYVLYRHERTLARDSQVLGHEVEETSVDAGPALNVVSPTGTAPLDRARLRRVVAEAVSGLEGVDGDLVLSETMRNLYDGISSEEVSLALIMAARTLVEAEPNYTYVASRLLLDKLRGEAIGFLLGEGKGKPLPTTQAELTDRYAEYFRAYIEHGVKIGMLDPKLASYDLDRVTGAILSERDLAFTFLGMQTLYDRYFLHEDGTRFELPQAFFLRVAMGLALEEDDREGRTIEFYQLLTSFDFMCSTPTLFNAGTARPQLSSCFLTTVDDDLDAIFQGIKNNALLAKYSGGLGNDWTPIRSIGAHIKGTNGQSQGLVPFLKIANDTAVAVNQGGKRKGAVCAYLETWHMDIEEFLDLRKNTGDDRRRTHDMNTANWVPDLFMQRVEANAKWTLFSPDETPDLHDAYGLEFKQKYEAYEAAFERGELRVGRQVQALDLWRKMLTMVFETGHPWITFKDPCNLRSPQRHTGVVHSSNLCTEITLNTNKDEVAVCNLGSINLAQHVTERADGTFALDLERLQQTVTTAVRMLDNVININLYTIPEARNSNLKHRPVGLGLMGFQDALFKLRLAYTSDGAIEFADESMEAISYFAISASSQLAAERGAYESFAGSLWSQGVLPIDSITFVQETRTLADGSIDLQQDTSSRMDWASLRETVKTQGMRNSNVMAIAPTATISNIVGVAQSIEPLYRNLFVKSNMSGDFTVVNDYLVRDLKSLGLWDEVMIADLKYFDGTLSQIDRIPADLKNLYATAFEVEPEWLIRAASRRQKWLDQAQSLNLYMMQPSGRKLDDMYRSAWRSGLKTTYYLRSQSATHVEKSTLRGTDGKLNAVSPVLAAALEQSNGVVAKAPETPAAQELNPGASAAVSPSPAAAVSPTIPVVGNFAALTPAIDPGEFTIDGVKACLIEDPECEACQ
ncbi:ribonucleoside-diphosphate reductase subunit alpha [Micrococcales bacterium 31B]|nr:ribonucleoside-diphosphate reductase subunit alpha [Micrococcales bacterium 31B]